MYSLFRTAECSAAAAVATAEAPAAASAGPSGNVLAQNAGLYSTPAPVATGSSLPALPQPVRYEELQREVMMSLKPDLFEGLRFDFTKPFNQNFAVCHSFFMGNADVPAQPGAPPLKMAVGTYEFGANLVSARGDMAVGRVLTDGRMTGRVKVDLSDAVSLKVQTQMSPEPGMSQGMVDVDFKGTDWNGQVKLGNNQFYGLNYFQSVTPNLTLGGEAFWLRAQGKSGTGFAARHAGTNHVATAQVATTGLVSLGYVHRVSDKVSLASDFLWNWQAREATASFGYDYLLRQCRLRGRIDTEGRVAAFLEERVNVGVNFVLSAELDHLTKNSKFGLGMTVGE